MRRMRVALLAIEKTHFLATDAGPFDQRAAHLVGGQDTKQMNWRPFRSRASIQRSPAVPERAEFDGDLLRLPNGLSPASTNGASAALGVLRPHEAKRITFG
jgi:hypothetical protein